MSAGQADLVIQISASAACPEVSQAQSSEETSLAAELRRRLEPGAEIALSCNGFRALTSVVWIDDMGLHQTFHAGVRLLAVSSLSEDPLNPS